MLASRAENWKQQWLQEGELKGRQEGELKGRQEGELKGRQEGELKGRQEGELKGILKGKSALLIRLLERRFGTLPGWARDRIAAADAAALEDWSLRVLDAASLDDVLR
jgi:predicted transposase YdaD